VGQAGSCREWGIIDMLTYCWLSGPSLPVISSDGEENQPPTFHACWQSVSIVIGVVASQVTATRKGVRNQLKNLLWRSKSSASELPKATGSGLVDMSLGGQTAEGQLRSLADLAFLMQDYDTCLSTLRLLASDLKADKEWRHYAAVQVFAALFQSLAAIYRRKFGEPLTVDFLPCINRLQ
jgi:hypothetical protein